MSEENEPTQSEEPASMAMIPVALLAEYLRLVDVCQTHQKARAANQPGKAYSKEDHYMMMKSEEWMRHHLRQIDQLHSQKYQNPVDA